jgi:hypothetical protein
MPYPRVDKSTVTFEHNLIDIDIISQSWALELGNYIINVFKDVFLMALKPLFDYGGFPLIINKITNELITNVNGEMPNSLIDVLV